MTKIELVTRKSLENRLLACLKEHRLPDYLFSLGGRSTTAEARVTEPPQLPHVFTLKKLLAAHAADIVSHLPRNVGLISVGAGDLSFDRVLLDALCGRGGNIRYMPVKVSGSAVDEALAAASNLPVDSTGIVAFVDDLARLRQYWKPPVLLCLLGDDFCNQEPDTLLETVSAQLEPKDFFLFDCSLCPARSADEREWQREIDHIRPSENNRVCKLERLVRHGLNPKDCEFEQVLVLADTPLGKACRARETVRILRNTSLFFERTRMPLSAGDAIQMGLNYKYTRAQVAAALWRRRFRVAKTFVSPDESAMLVLARKLYVRTESDPESDTENEAARTARPRKGAAA